MAPVATHIPNVNGFINIHADPSGFAGTTIIDKLNLTPQTAK
jgi:hypothetical protein